MSRNSEPKLPAPCPVCQKGTVWPCTHDHDPSVVGCCNNPDCGYKIKVTGRKRRSAM
jgi:hypothetical protein